MKGNRLNVNEYFIRGKFFPRHIFRDYLQHGLPNEIPDPSPSYPNRLIPSQPSPTQPNPVRESQDPIANSAITIK